MREPSWSIPSVALHVGDCLDVLKEMPDASVDAVITDPPYGLTDLTTPRVLEAIAAWMSGNRDHVPDARGFMGRAWDAFVPPPGVWDECLRVLKPGGHLVAFAGTRTWDLMGLSIRIAGFELRDTVADLMGADAPGLIWAHGQGFPKSLDVSKAIDKAAGAKRDVVGSRKVWLPGGSTYAQDEWSISARRLQDVAVTAPATAEAARWSGWGTALKPGWEPIILARKPLDGTVAANVVKHGTGALNIDGCRIGSADKLVRPAVQRRDNDVYGKGLGAGVQDEPVGRWPTNLVFSHSPECVEDEPCAPDCPVAELDRQSGVTRDGVATNRNRSGVMPRAIYGQMNVPPPVDVGYGGSGGASRFFPTFRYEGKAPSSERPKLDDGTAHATVKPLDLIRWLARLITPPGGLILDPFGGSGTTAEAALIENFRSVLVELEPAHAELIKARLSKPIAPMLDLGGSP